MGTPTAVHVDSLPSVRISTPSKRSCPGRPTPSQWSNRSASLHADEIPCIIESHSALHSNILAIFCRIGCTTGDDSAHIKGWPIASRARDSRSKRWLVVPIQLLLLYRYRYQTPHCTARDRAKTSSKKNDNQPPHASSGGCAPASSAHGLAYDQNDCDPFFSCADGPPRKSTYRYSENLLFHLLLVNAVSRLSGRSVPF
jgi:hypothetical protein